MKNFVGSSLIFAAIVAVASPAFAFNGSEEDFAAPHGSFVSTMTAPVYFAQAEERDGQPVLAVNSEEDLAAPHGSFVSTMPVPELASRDTRVADDSSDGNLREIVAAGLE